MVSLLYYSLQHMQTKKSAKGPDILEVRPCACQPGREDGHLAWESHRIELSERIGVRGWARDQSLVHISTQIHVKMEKREYLYRTCFWDGSLLTFTYPVFECGTRCLAFCRHDMRFSGKGGLRGSSKGNFEDLDS